MWEDWYDYIPTWEPIIISELAERRGPLNPRKRNNDASPSTRPKHSPGPSSLLIQSPGPATTPTQSPDPVVQQTIPTAQPFQMMPGAYPSPFMYPNPYMFPFSSPMAC
ncbi:hypothetical protein Gotur_024759 [Gossypium turneri]